MYLIYIANLTAEGPLSKRECNLYKRGLALLWKTNFPLAPVLKIDSRAPERLIFRINLSKLSRGPSFTFV